MDKKLLIISIGGFVIQLMSLLVFYISRINFTPTGLTLLINSILFGSVNIALLVCFVFGLVKKE